MTTYIIADLHLKPEMPHITEGFIGFLQGQALQANQLFILGDLFEYWLGDDALSHFHQPILQAMKTYTDSGRSLFFMRGNRDFMLGKTFAMQIPMQILPDPSLLVIEGQKVILSHGDKLCSGDFSYKCYRVLMQNPLSRALLSSLPLVWRERLAKNLRQQSAKANQQKSLAIMDVTPSMVGQWLRKYQCTKLIHGHTHRPKLHNINLNGQKAQRIVVGDWHSQGSLISIQKNGAIELRSFAFEPPKKP